MANPFTSKQAPAMMSGDWESQQRQIEYERKLAEKLAGDTEMPQGQMVGGQYVRPAWTQMLAKALNPMLAQRQRESADQKAAKLGADMQAERTGTMDRVAKALQGTPANPGQDIYTDDYTAVPAADQQGYGATPAIPGSRDAALAELAKSRDPAFQQMAMAAQLKGLEPKKPIVVGRTLMDDTGKQIGVDSTWQGEQQAAREAKRQEIEMRLADQRTSREDAAALRRELAANQIEARKEMAGALGGMGKEKAPTGYRFQPDGSLAAITGGPADPKAKTGADGMPKLTEAQGKANLYQSRAAESDRIMTELEGKYSPMAINAKQKVGETWLVGGGLEAGANAMLPENAQKVEQSQRDFVNAVLRQESGAVINPDEFKNAQKQYFPQPGDGKQVIDQKKKNRATAIAGLKVMAGPAAKPAAPSGGGVISVDW